MLQTQIPTEVTGITKAYAKRHGLRLPQARAELIKLGYAEAQRREARKKPRENPE